MNYQDVQTALRSHVDPEKAAFFPRFFKTGPGQYGEGDKFLGVTVPATRSVVKQFRDLPLSETKQLLTSEWHEDRLAALFILGWQYPRANTAGKQAIYDLYMSHTNYINNWDLVDQSAHLIVGPHLSNNPNKLAILTKLASSSSLWERRIAMMATFHYIRAGKADEALTVADILLHDSHDLIQKATGWTLREIGKRVDRTVLLAYLDAHAHDMPRTTLRYAIEHLSSAQRAHYMAARNGNSKNNS